ETRDLRHCGIDEDDAALEHLHAERHVRRRDQQPGDERRPEDSEARRVQIHLITASRRAIVSSNRPNRSFALSVPPTVNGIIVVAMPVRSDRNSAARGSLYGEYTMTFAGSRFIWSTSSARWLGLGGIPGLGSRLPASR